MNVIEQLREEREITNYFENLEDHILENFDEEDQATMFTAIGAVLESDEIPAEHKLDVIENILNEAEGVQNPSENTVSRTQKKGKQVPTKAEKNVSGEKELQQEAAAPSCHEKQWKRPKEIAWGARAANKVTWGKEVNKWFESFPGKGKETR